MSQGSRELVSSSLVGLELPDEQELGVWYTAWAKNTSVNRFTSRFISLSYSSIHNLHQYIYNSLYTLSCHDNKSVGNHHLGRRQEQPHIFEPPPPFVNVVLVDRLVLQWFQAIFYIDPSPNIVYPCLSITNWLTDDIVETWMNWSLLIRILLIKCWCLWWIICKISKPNKPNIPNETYPIKPNQTKHTKSNLFSLNSSISDHCICHIYHLLSL